MKNMRTIVVFLLCCLVTIQALNIANFNSNTAITSQVNIQISASNRNINENHLVHGPAVTDNSINNDSEEKHVEPKVTNKTTDTRKVGELSKKKCEEYYPPIPQTRNIFYGGNGYPYTVRRRRWAQNLYHYQYQYSPLTQYSPQYFQPWQYNVQPIYIPPEPQHMWNGKETLAKEFPHMALIGLMKDTGFDRWICGGSLISHHFVLTAGHCLISEKLIVRLGELDTATETDDANPQDFRIKKMFRHPEYKTSTHYHDIGLIELDTPVTLTEYIGIACLDQRKEVDTNEMLTITGWGQTRWKGPLNSYLLKADVYLNPHNICNNSYRNYSMLPFGIVDKTQLCAVGFDREDACKGDSGGPLQVLNKYHGRTRVYNIVGVTSFGPACGYSNTHRPGVYTRVHYYISWIESIVWP